MSELPKGWVEAKISSVALTQSGGTPSTSKKEFWANGNVPWINSGCLKDKTIKVPTTYITKLGLDNSSAKVFPQNTVVIALTGATTGKVGLLEFPCSTNQSVTGILPSLVFIPYYLFYFLQTARKDILERTLGSAQPHINKQIVDEFEIPLAPLPEQRRIVAKLEKLLHRVDACKERLDKIPAILKRFRQSVLASACSGRLTKDWREKNQDACAISNSAGEPFEVPDSWRWINLSETGDMRRGRSKHRPRDAAFLYGGHYPFIQTGDIAQSGGRIVRHKQTYSEAGLAQSKLWPKGTICITIAANIAESAILTYPACFPDSVVGIIANDKICVPEYIEYFIRVAKSDLSAFAPATAQKNINISILNEVKVPLPPLPEQREIVRRVEVLFKKADEIEARYKKAKAFVDKLTQSILAKAFRGELVPQDPDDEPASVLFERIKTERTKHKTIYKGKKR